MLRIYVKEKYNRIDGIIQCTGIFRNNFVIRKSNQEFFEVIAPKVYGTKNLDNCFADENYLLLLTYLRDKLQGRSSLLSPKTVN